jgi:hypothetical protein
LDHELLPLRRTAEDGCPYVVRGGRSEIRKRTGELRNDELREFITA